MLPSWRHFHFYVYLEVPLPPKNAKYLRDKIGSLLGDVLQIYVAWRYWITDLYCEEILPPVDCQLIWTISYFPSFSHISTLMQEIRTSYRLARGISSTNSVNSHPPSPLGIVDEEPQALPFLSTLMPPGRGLWPLPWQIWKRYLLRFACLRIGK